MRKVFPLLCLLAILSLAVPAQAQHRANLPVQRAGVRLFDQGGPGFTLNKLFSPEHFRMSHSFEMSMGSFGGHTSSLGMYTNTMQWQFNNKLAARVDIAVAQNLFGGDNVTSFNGLAFQQRQGPQVFLRNAEVAYRPTENVQFNISVRQSPYGAYMSPFGYYGMGYDYFGMRHSDPFFWDRGRW